MRTLTLHEQLELTASVSLTQLLSGVTDFAGSFDASVTDYANWLVAGGWPGWSHNGAESTLLTESYLEQIFEHDFPDMAGRRRDPRLMQAFLRSYATATAQPMTFANIRRRMGEILDRVPDQNTPATLHDFAQRLFLIEDQPAWSPNIRSKTTLLQAPKRHLADTSLAAALLGANPGQLLADLPTFGHFFESLVVHDLRVFAQAAGARGVYHFRDAAGRNEIDAIVEDKQGNWVGFEVKLSTASVSAAVESMQRAAAHISKKPAALVVIVPNGSVMRVRENVLVVPFGALGV